ncbi:hypothetical protein LSAT2_012230 [Lamellibrachia satsuma]|nr:hypothetical protein LSAT2_012230 [Lamellibrachia satsuma]
MYAVSLQTRDHGYPLTNIIHSHTTTIPVPVIQLYAATPRSAPQDISPAASQLTPKGTIPAESRSIPRSKPSDEHRPRKKSRNYYTTREKFDPGPDDSLVILIDGEPRSVSPACVEVKIPHKHHRKEKDHVHRHHHSGGTERDHRHHHHHHSGGTNNKN